MIRAENNTLYGILWLSFPDKSYLDNNLHDVFVGRCSISDSPRNLILTQALVPSTFVVDSPSEVFPVGFACRNGIKIPNSMSELIKQSGAIGATMERVYRSVYGDLVYLQNAASIDESKVTWTMQYALYREDARSAADILFDDIIEW